jgi:acetyl-CoA carboxylase beta subunit
MTNVSSKILEELIQDNGNLDQCLSCKKPLDVEELMKKTSICFSCKKQMDEMRKQMGFGHINIGQIQKKGLH